MLPQTTKPPDTWITSCPEVASPQPVVFTHGIDPSRVILIRNREVISSSSEPNSPTQIAPPSSVISTPQIRLSNSEGISFSHRIRAGPDNAEYENRKRKAERIRNIFVPDRSCFKKMCSFINIFRRCPFILSIRSVISTCLSRVY